MTDSRYTTEANKEAVGFEVIAIKKGLAESLPGLLSRIALKATLAAGILWEVAILRNLL